MQIGAASSKMKSIFKLFLQTMKRFSKSFWPLMLSLCVCLFAAACDDDPEPGPEPVLVPSISISNIVPDVESIAFTLTTENAKAYEYACIPTTEFESGDYEMTRFEGAAPAEPIKVEHLTAETAYTIVARAFNDDQSTKLESKSTTTLAAPKEAPVLTISEPKVSAQSVTFTITHKGDAATYNYAVYVKGETAPSKFESVTATDKGATITVKDLKGNTNYVIEAYGKIADLEGAHVTKEFSTESTPVEVAVSDITSTDANIKVTMDKEQCITYYLGGYETSSQMTDDDILSGIKSAVAEMEHKVSFEGLFSDTKSVKVDGIKAPLSPETTYVIWWVAFDANKDNDAEEREAVTASMIHKMEFTTEALDFTSPATVTVSVEAVGAQTASVKFTPSSDAVKYFYDKIESSKIMESYFNDKLLADYLISKNITETAEKTVNFSSLTTNTAYTFCALAVDADGKYSQIAKAEKSTTGYDVTSPVQFTLAQFSGTVADPQENAQFTITGDLDNIEEIRYMNITRAEYSSSTFNAKDEAVQNVLLANTYPTRSVLPEELTRGRLPKFTKLTASENYYCFALILDKNGKFTTAQKVAYKTAAYDQTGTATATWEIAEERQAVTGKGELTANMVCKLKITPNENCVESWVYVITEGAFNNLSTKEVIRQAKGQDAGWYGKGTQPWITGEKWVGDNYVVVMICKDKDGKYNNIKRDLTPIVNKYSEYNGKPDPDEPSPKGSN